MLKILIILYRDIFQIHVQFAPQTLYLIFKTKIKNFANLKFYYIENIYVCLIF